MAFAMGALEFPRRAPPRARTRTVGGDAGRRIGGRASAAERWVLQRRTRRRRRLKGSSTAKEEEAAALSEGTETGRRLSEGGIGPSRPIYMEQSEVGPFIHSIGLAHYPPQSTMPMTASYVSNIKIDATVVTVDGLMGIKMIKDIDQSLTLALEHFCFGNPKDKQTTFLSDLITLQSDNLY